jgi:hypothetical protein
MTRYAITCIHKDGERKLIFDAQARHLYDDQIGATAALEAFMRESGERLVVIYGEQARGTFRVDPFECWPNGDPAGIYAKSDR